MELADYMVPMLILFQGSTDTENFQTTWRAAIIASAFKTGDKNCVKL